MSPIAIAWPISGLAAFTFASMLAGDMFLPRGVDDQLLLAVDDLEVAVVVELADVAGVEQALGVDRLTRLVGLVAVARHDDRPADQHLAVLGQLDLGARARAAPQCRS